MSVLHRSIELLEPCDGKLSRTVLRGESARKGADLPDPTLATKLYYHYKKNQKLGKVPKGCKFNIINFVDVEYSKRVNPIQAKYINNLAAASETAETLLESLQKGKKEGGGGSDQFFQTSAVNFLAACIYVFRELRAGTLRCKRKETVCGETARSADEVLEADGCRS